MKQGLSLTALAQEIERQQGAKRDFVADTRKMSAMIEDDGSVQMSLDRRGESGIGAYERFKIREYAHRQLGSHLKIPAQYYDRMRTDAPELLADNINHWMHKNPEQRLVRTLDNSVRAFLSHKYRPIDNDEVATAILPVLHSVGEGSGLQIESTQITERKLYIKALFPRIEGEVERGDAVQSGVVISNSEIGAGALSVQTLIFRLVCKNGMIAPDAGLRKAHVGRSLGDGEESAVEIFRSETIRADNKAFVMKLQDIVRAAASQARFESLLIKMRDTAGRKIEGDIVKAVEVVQRQFSLNDGETSGVLKHLATGGNLSQWGLLNAMTRYSQDIDDYDRATEFEMFGGKVLDLKPNEWKAIANAA